MKFKLLTHNDLDAAGCAICAKLAFKDDVEVEFFRNPDYVSKRLEKMMQMVDGKVEHDDYDFVFVADISFNEEVASIVNNSGLGKKIHVFDHHPTAKHLNMYDWALVREDYDVDKKTCGANLFYQYLAVQGLDIPSHAFINLIREYDTWEWEANENINAKYLSNLLDTYGLEKFIDKYVEFFSCNNANRWADVEHLFNEKDRILLEAEQERVKRYIDMKSKEVMPIKIGDYNAALLFGEQYHSELGNEIGKMFPEYDLVAIVNFARGGISFRTRRDDVNVSELAKRYGGGGHVKASGCPIPGDGKRKFIDCLF